MPSDKRERRRASKQVRDQAYAAAMQRKKRRQGRIVTGVAMVAALGIGFLGVLSFVDRNEPENVNADRPGPTTSTTSFDTPCPKRDGTSPRKSSFRRPPPFCIDVSKSYKAEVLTDVGTFTMELNTKDAPETTNNFVFLARYHFYDAVPFNRVKPGFIVQGGNPPGEGVTGPGYVFADENVPMAPARYEVGQVLMARDRPNSNGSQFIIIMGPEGENLPLVFGQFAVISDGMDVVRRIEADGSDNFTPKVLHTIQKVTIIES